MIDRDPLFVRALNRGEIWALEGFYDKLRQAGDDDGFWSYLSSLVPRVLRGEAQPDIGRLKDFQKGRNYDAFLRIAPVGVLVAFLLLAMLFAGCAEPKAGTPTKVTQEPPTAPGPSATASPGASPSTVASTGAQPTAQPSATPDPQSMSAQELKARLSDYIGKAELPASEKRRLRAVLDVAQEPTVLQTRSDLVRLFRENEPAKIATILESMVLFQQQQQQQQTTPPVHPAVQTRYKGVNFRRA